MPLPEARPAPFQSQARFRAAFDQLPAGIVVFTSEGRIAMANRAFCAMLGRSASDLLGAHVSELTHAEDVAATSEALRALARGGEATQIEKRYVRSDGTVIWVHNAVSPVRDDDGNLLYLIAVSTEITDRIEAEAKLRDAEERSRLALSAANAGSWSWYASDSRLEWDDRQFTLFDVDPDAFAPTYAALLERVHADDRERLDSELSEAREEKRGFRTQFRIVLEDGSPRWIEAWGDVVLDAAGEVERMNGLDQDITERKSEEAARELIDEITNALSSSLDYDDTLRAVVGCAVPLFADFAAVYIRDDAHDYTRLAYDTADPARVALTEHKLSGDARRGIGRVFASGEPELFEEITDDVLRDIATSDEHLDVLRAAGFVSGVVVPLFGHGQVIGAMSFSTAESKRRYGPREADLAGEIARRASIALENARIHAEIQHTLALKAQSDERFRLASEASRLGTWEWDLGERVAWSESLEHIYGLEPGTFPGTMDAFASAIHPDDLDYVMGCVSAAMDEGADLDMEHRIVRPDGDVRWLQARGQVVRDQHGKPVRMVGIGMDVTEQKLAGEREAQIQERYRALAESLPAIVSTAAADGGITYFNEQWYDYTGYTKEQAADPAQRPLVFHPDDREMVTLRWRQAMTDGQPYRIEYRLRRHDGEYRWHLGQVVPVKTNGRIESWTSTSIDIDDRKRAEAEREELLADLRRANAAKDEFLGLVSHELKTPITTIFGNAEVLTRRGGAIDEEGRAQALSDIRHEAERLHRIVDNLLILARLESGYEIETEPLIVVRLVERLIDDHRRQYPHREMMLCEEGSRKPVVASPIYVEQALRNLISNAEKYSRPELPIEIAIQRQEGTVTVAVRDRGAGIPIEEQAAIFTPFYRSSRTSTVAHGVGVGLAVCKRLIEAQGGRIWVRSRDGGGSEFGIALPAPDEGPLVD